MSQGSGYETVCFSPSNIIGSGINNVVWDRDSDTLPILTKQLLVAKPQGKEIQVCPSRMTV